MSAEIWLPDPPCRYYNHHPEAATFEGCSACKRMSAAETEQDRITRLESENAELRRALEQAKDAIRAVRERNGQLEDENRELQHRDDYVSGCLV